jgi:hypothetical protein
MKSIQKLLADAKLASSKISKLESQKDRINKKHDAEKQKNYFAESDEKSVIEKKYAVQRSKIEDENESTNNTYNNSIDGLDVLVTDVKKTIYFLKTVKKDSPFDAGKIIGYGTYRNEPSKVSRLYAYKDDDDLLYLSYILYEVNRPKNKFALAIVGHSKIGSRDSSSMVTKILELPYTYGAHLRDDANANILVDVKYLPTFGGAKNYAQNNPIEKVLKKFLSQFEVAKKECLETVKNYDLKDFEEYRIQEAAKYFEHNSRNLEYYAKKHNIKKDSWKKLTKSEKIKISGDVA